MLFINFGACRVLWGLRWATDSLCKLKDICTELNGYLSDPKSKSKGRGKRTELVVVNND